MTLMDGLKNIFGMKYMIESKNKTNSVFFVPLEQFEFFVRINYNRKSTDLHISIQKSYLFHLTRKVQQNLSDYCHLLPL